MARVCDSCNQRFDPAEEPKLIARIKRYGLVGADIKGEFSIGFIADDWQDNDYDVCANCILIGVRRSLKDYSNQIKEIDGDNT